MRHSSVRSNHRSFRPRQLVPGGRRPGAGAIRTAQEAATERVGAGWGRALVCTVHPITMATTVASFVARPMAARPVARKAMAGAPLRATASNGSSTVMRASWLPGSTPPAHLKGTLPGDFGA
jgi:hypothetical protein